jgi:hypothetical protein
MKATTENETSSTDHQDPKQRAEKLLEHLENVGVALLWVLVLGAWLLVLGAFTFN